MSNLKVLAYNNPLTYYLPGTYKNAGRFIMKRPALKKRNYLTYIHHHARGIRAEAYDPNTDTLLLR